MKKITRLKDAGLFEAIRQRDITTVQEAISQGDNVNAVTMGMGYGPVTPLIEAVKADQIEIAKLLVLNGADPEQMVSFSGNKDQPVSAYEMAARFNAMDCLVFLTTPISPKSLMDRHPLILHQAVSGRSFEAVEYLAKLGFPLNKQNESGNTVLHHILKQGAMNMGELLCRLGASPFIKNNEGQTPLDIAVVPRSRSLGMNEEQRRRDGLKKVHTAYEQFEIKSGIATARQEFGLTEYYSPSKIRM